MSGSADRSLRILVAHCVSRARSGGMSRLMGYIHDAVSSQGHVVDYFCSEDVPSAFGNRLARHAFPMLAFQHALSQARAGRKYDLINLHEPCAAPTLLGRKLIGNPAVVVTSHGIERRGWKIALEDMRLAGHKLPLRTRLSYPLTSLWQSALALRYADHIFCLNSEDEDYLVNRLNRRRRDITRVFPGAELVYAIAAQRRSYREAHRLLFAGSWIGRKGVGDLVIAFTMLCQEDPKLTLTVLGGGASDCKVRESFPADLRERITCTTASSDVEAAAIFAAADIFVLPSLFEGTPLTLIEAMMSGLPLVTTATCGMKDVIRNQDNGLLIPLRSPGAIVQAVRLLMKNPALRERIGRAAQQEAASIYTWDHASVPVHEAYLRLSDRSRDAAGRIKCESAVQN